MTESAPATTYYPGKTLGIVGFVLAFVLSVPAIVVNAVALHESRRAGFSNSFALAGLIISVVVTVFKVMAAIIALVVVLAMLRYCGDWSQGAHLVLHGFALRCTP